MKMSGQYILLYVIKAYSLDRSSFLTRYKIMPLEELIIFENIVFLSHFISSKENVDYGHENTHTVVKVMSEV